MDMHNTHYLILPAFVIVIVLETSDASGSFGNHAFGSFDDPVPFLPPPGPLPLPPSPTNTKSEKKLERKKDIKCGGTITPESQIDYFSSPNYQSPYPNNVLCKWKVKIGPKTFFRLVFRKPFGLQNSKNCRLDSIKIYRDDSYSRSGRKLKGTWCGNKSPPPRLYTSSIEVEFKSDERTTGKGFMASLDFKKVCGKNFNTRQGEVSSPRYGTGIYDNNLMCTWKIRGEKEYHITNLRFQEPFDIKGEENGMCTGDYVEVLDTDNELIFNSKGKFCGMVAPKNISTDKTLVVRFRSDRRGNGLGFIAKWNTECKTLLRYDSGKIHSPHFPKNYPNNINCEWKIEVDRDQSVELTFEAFALEATFKCSKDYVMIYQIHNNGRRHVKGRWCGANKPEVIKAISSTLVIVFHSNSRITDGGFSATWKSVQNCGFKSTKDSGFLKSPFYPQDYPNSRYCLWEIKPANHKNITMTFDKEFNIEDTVGCGLDYVEQSPYEAALVVGHETGFQLQCGYLLQ